MSIRILLTIVIQALVTLLAPCEVLGGELVELDIVAAQSALLKLGDEGKDYQFEPKMSGCYFSSCSTELVMFRREAIFTRVISDPDAIVVRKRKMFCWSDDRKWKCSPDNRLLAYVQGASSPIGISKAVTDAEILDITSFFESECFRNQTDAYQQSHPSIRELVLSSEHVFAIEPRGIDLYDVISWSAISYVLKKEMKGSNCRYSVQGYGKIRI